MDFQSSVEDIDEITKKISVSIPGETVTKEYEGSLSQLSRSAKIKGFRPGKIPRKMVEKFLGDRARIDVANKLISEALRNVYRSHSLEVVGEPQIEDLQKIEPAEPLEFNVKVSLFPTPTITNYKGRTIQVPRRTVTDEDVEKTVEKLLESKAELKPIEERKVAEKGDVVALSISVQVESGEPSRAEPFVDELGAGKLPEDVENQIVGMTVGDSKDITSIASEEHPNPELRGKSVVYKVTLHGLFTKNLPQLDDAFVGGLGMGIETVDALRTKLREDLAKRFEEDMKNDAHGAILDLLVSENPFKVPGVMVDDEIRGIVARYGFAGRRDVDPQSIDIEQFRPQFEEFALNRIRCAIIIDRIGSAEEVNVEEADRERMIERVAEQNGTTVEAARKALLDKERLMSFLLEVRRSKILEHLLANTTIEYTEPTGDEQAAA